MKRLRSISLIALLLVVATSAAKGAIIYQDDFNGDPAVNLNGLAPDIDNNGGTNKWQAYSGYKANGVAASGNASINQGAWLAFAPQAGNVYQLSASFTGVGPDGTSVAWYAMGFAQNVPTTLETGDNRFTVAPTLGKAWMLFRANNPTTNTNQYFLGNTTSGTAGAAAWSTGSPLNEGGDIDLRIILDTNPTTWTATFYAKRPADSSYTQVSPSALPLNAQDIQAIGIARTSGNLSGNVTFFQLATVPEPMSGALALLGLSMIGVARAPRRRVGV
jgi:hypothetical protein